MTKRIATVYFEKRHLERAIYGGVFDVPAVARGEKPFILEVRDHVQREQLPHILGGGQMPRQIAGEHIAADIIQHWTTGVLGMTGNVRPGIWIVRDVITLADENGIPLKDQFGVVQTRPATEEEKAAMWAEDLAENLACQARWGDFNIQKGDALWNDQNQEKRILINPTMKAAAPYYKREVEWTGELKQDDRKSCQFCGRSIARTVVKCQFCHEIVDRAAYDKLNAKPAVAPPLDPGQKKQQAA